MTPRGWLVVSVHDVAPPHRDRVRRILDALAKVGVGRRSLLVIPNFQGRWPLDRHEQFVADLRQWQDDGDEMVLHGYEHVSVGTPRGLSERLRHRWLTVNEGEFLSLGYRAARDRIERGLALVREARLDVRGFIAPAWLISDAALQATRDCGFEYTNSYFRFLDLARGRSCLAPSLVFGPGRLGEDLGMALQRPLSLVDVLPADRPRRAAPALHRRAAPVRADSRHDSPAADRPRADDLWGAAGASAGGPGRPDRRNRMRTRLAWTLVLGGLLAATVARRKTSRNTSPCARIHFAVTDHQGAFVTDLGPDDSPCLTTAGLRRSRASSGECTRRSASR